MVRNDALTGIGRPLSVCLDAFPRESEADMTHCSTFNPGPLRPKGITAKLDHLRRMWKRGEFPEPIHLSPRKLAWYETVIDAWIASRARERAA